MSTCGRCCSTRISSPRWADWRCWPWCRCCSVTCIARRTRPIRRRTESHRTESHFLMRQIRLYVDVPLAGVAELVLPDAAARHATRVLRLTAGHPLVLFNGDGNDYDATLQDVARKSVGVRVLGHRVVAREAPWPLTLAQCLARGDKMDLVVQKATELGVTRIVPLLSERSGVRLDAARADKRLRHWQDVAATACEQCGRARLPQVDAPRSLDAWLAGLPASSGLRL